MTQREREVASVQVVQCYRLDYWRWEHEGLISKKIYPEIPLKAECRSTFRARELGVILRGLGRWAQRWKPPRISATPVKWLLLLGKFLDT
jgi:HxlR-like helix-turn-helix